MKKVTKIIASGLSATLMCTALAGCGGEDKKTFGDTLTYWTQFNSSQISSMADMLLYQEMEKVTGVKIEFIHPVAGSTGQEAFNTLIASNDLPDMIEYGWDGYAGGPDAAIDDGLIVSLNEHLKDWAPNYYDYLEGEKNDENGGYYGLQSQTQNGNYYGFKTLNIGTARGFSGLIVRKDLLDKWGFDVPATIDDWDAIFARAKSEGYEKPFTCNNSVFSVNAATVNFNTAYDVGKAYYVEDGKVTFGAFEPAYKDYVAKIAEWVSKGYIDKNFVTNQSTDIEGNMTNEISVACVGYIGSTMGKLIPAMEERNPGYELVACPYPVMKEGDKARFQELQYESKDPTICITTACDDVQTAMKWCDYFYSEEGNILKTFGVEGDTYTLKEIDGETHYIYTDKILKPETSGAQSVNEALYIFMRPSNSPGLDQHPDYLDGYYPYQSQRDALDIWNENIESARKVVLPPLTYTNDESTRMAILNQQYQASFETAVTEIMLGNKSLNEYDTVISEAKKNAYDELLKIQNDAYERYMKKQS